MTGSGAPAPRRRYGGFDVWRIGAALGVVLTHSFALTGHFEDRPHVSVGGWTLAFGNIGVAVFFTISGFLVSMSLDRSRSTWAFLRNRIVRIYPALIVVVLLTTFVLGPLVTTLPLFDYFHNRQTVAYVAYNSTLLMGVKHYLPGVFDGGPVNASLWSLPYEVWAYILLLLVSVLGFLRRTWTTALLLGAALIVFRYGTYEPYLSVRHSIYGMHLWNAAELAVFFFAGVFLLRIRDRIDLRKLALPGAALMAAAFVVRDPAPFLLGLPLLVIGTGARSNAMTTAVASLGDPSYGIYICSYPIQQLLRHEAGITSPVAMFLLSGTIATALGYLSWHVVEKRALARIKRPPPHEPLPPVVVSDAVG